MHSVPIVLEEGQTEERRSPLRNRCSRDRFSEIGRQRLNDFIGLWIFKPHSNKYVATRFSSEAFTCIGGRDSTGSYAVSSDLKIPAQSSILVVSVTASGAATKCIEMKFRCHRKKYLFL